VVVKVSEGEGGGKGEKGRKCLPSAGTHTPLTSPALRIGKVREEEKKEKKF